MSVEVTFASKNPHKTCWLEITHPVGEPPNEITKELLDLGWRMSELQPLIPLDGKFTIYIYGPVGSGLFNSWTDTERRQIMRKARVTLAKHGLTNVPHWKKTLSDLI